MEGIFIGLLLVLLVAAMVALGVMGSKQATRLHGLNQAHASEVQALSAKISALESRLKQIDFVHTAALNVEKENHAQALETLNSTNVQRQLLRQVEEKLAASQQTVGDQQTRLLAADQAIKQQSADHVTKLQQLETALKPLKAQFEQTLADNQKLQTMVKAEQEKAKELQTRLGEQQTQYVALKSEQSALQKRLDNVLANGADGEDLQQALLKITRLEDGLKISQTQNTQISRQLKDLEAQKQQLLQLQAQQAQQTHTQKALSQAASAAPTADMAELLRRAKEYDNVAQALKQSEAGLKKAHDRMAELEEKLKTADALKAQWGSQNNGGAAQPQTVLLAATPTASSPRKTAGQNRLSEQEVERLANNTVLEAKLNQLEQALAGKNAQLDALNNTLAQHSKPNAGVEKELAKTKKQLEKASVRIADLSLQLAQAQGVRADQGLNESFEPTAAAPEKKPRKPRTKTSAKSKTQAQAKPSVSQESAATGAVLSLFEDDADTIRNNPSEQAENPPQASSILANDNTLNPTSAVAVAQSATPSTKKIKTKTTVNNKIKSVKNNRKIKK